MLAGDARDRPDDASYSEFIDPNQSFEEVNNGIPHSICTLHPSPIPSHSDMASTIIYRPILLLSSLASAYSPKSRDIPHHRSLRDTTLPLSASAPDMALIASSRQTRSLATVNLSRKKMAMAQKLMDEALAEDADGWATEDDVSADTHGDYVCKYAA
jgi:hypothetical protein